MENHIDVLKPLCSTADLRKLTDLDNSAVMAFVSSFVTLCKPASVVVCGDSPQDCDMIRRRALERGEETPLATAGHTIHFDGIKDLARDKNSTKYLLKGTDDMFLNGIDKSQGINEMHGLLDGIMKGRDMIVSFYCLGPVGCEFSIYGVQLTDSYYVAHSENLLYRNGYVGIRSAKPRDFFRFVHSAGELDENNTSKNTDKRRMYIDLDDNIVYSVNTQYAGNTVGLKKLALRLSINKAAGEDWLSEHMFLMGVGGKSGRKTYFTGAFPSACGKTSTSMLQGESIVGDDIAFLRNRNGVMHAVNVEQGIFGIIEDVNAKYDPVLMKTLTGAPEVIFSNVLAAEDGVPHWVGKGVPEPDRGVNFCGEWFKGKTDEQGNEIPCSHKNARYTIRLKNLENVDEHLDNPAGLPVGGVIYGGRDSDTSVPVCESFSWEHGVITMAASLESETTAATLGKQGVRTFNPMSNLDFLSIPLGTYVANHLAFGAKLSACPGIFSVNYFLKDENGGYLNGIKDKHVWLKWMELRVHGEVKARRAPVGMIPLYEDLAELFRRLQGVEYTKEAYVKQFTLRILENLAKIQRIENIYREEIHKNVPDRLFELLEEQKQRLVILRSEKGDYVSPFELPME